MEIEYDKTIKTNSSDIQSRIREAWRSGASNEEIVLVLMDAGLTPKQIREVSFECADVLNSR